MPKLHQGRLVGRVRGEVGPRGISVPEWEEMRTASLDDLRRLVDQVEADLARESPDHHPAWLAKRAARLRTLIRQKERALEHRQRQGRITPR
ncbi:MAG: hypothetical protein AAF602_28690 [Myxococcota bacterium]